VQLARGRKMKDRAGAAGHGSSCSSRPSNNSAKSGGRAQDDNPLKSLKGEKDVKKKASREKGQSLEGQGRVFSKGGKDAVGEGLPFLALEEDRWAEKW